MQEGGIIQGEGEGESRGVIDLPPSLVKQIYQTDDVLNHSLLELQVSIAPAFTPDVK